MNLAADDLLLYARIADAGSFSRAAAALGLPKSTVSRRLAAFEATLGERLLTRTTRRLVLTEFGEALLEHAHRLAEEMDAAVQLAERRKAVPQGRLRVTMPPDLAVLMLVPMLARFGAEYPAVRVELDLSAHQVDLVAGGFDLAVRMGPLAEDASLVARRLGSFAPGLYASPDYLARRGTPQTPEQLAGHDALLLAPQAGRPLPMGLQNGLQQWQGLWASRFGANSVELLVRMALAGAGLVAVDERFVRPHLAAGTLLPVLPAWTLPPVTAWAVLPGRRLMPAKTRAFVEALIRTLADDSGD